MIDRITTLSQITKYESEQIASFTVAKAHTDAEKARLDQLAAERTARRQSLADQKTKINADIDRLNALLRRAGSRPAPPPAPATPPPYVEGRAGVVVNFAYAQLGKPYQWAADGPGSYDCSGLTLAAWRSAGVALPHNAAMQYNALPRISRGALQPGDLVFYTGLTHVAIYVGNGQVIHAPTFGDQVRVARIDMMTLYGYARPG